MPDQPVLSEAILPISPVSSRLNGLYFDVACDMARRWVFYADIMDNVVYKIRPEGTERETVLVTNNDGLVSMSYDWISRLIYFVDNIRNSLEVVHADDPHMHRQLRLDLKEPVSVVVHPLKGYLYFTEAKRPAKIWRCAGDAKDCKVIRNTTLGRPSGLTIDFQQNKLCWGDSILKHIQCSDLSGNNVQKINIDPEPIPSGMAIIGGTYVHTFSNTVIA